mmetsp:Transcript_33800/g.95661  ORF Transcript_33800/g.95661 Transcript_33800/m.95661 type:complete len:781 (-) Transcript_33800:215-2557(-)
MGCAASTMDVHQHGKDAGPDAAKQGASKAAAPPAVRVQELPAPAAKDAPLTTAVGQAQAKLTPAAVEAAPTPPAAAAAVPEKKEAAAAAAAAAASLEEKASFHGVTAQWLLEVFVPRVKEVLGVEELGEQTTEEIVKAVVKPDTADRSCCYAELPGTNSASPTFFVSHVWSRPFQELVQCLTKYLADKESEILWIDIFAVNQHSASTDPKANIATSVDAVKATKQTLVVLDPAGACFTRAWCLKEQHAAVAAADGETGKLILLPYMIGSADLEAFPGLMNTIDVEKAESSKPEDKAAILADISSAPGGLAAFNAELQQAMLLACAAMPSVCAEGTTDWAEVAYFSGVFLKNGGHFYRAQPLLEAAFEVFKAVNGEEDSETTFAANTLAMFLLERGEAGRAAELLEKVVETTKASSGEDSLESAVMMSNLGHCYQSTGQLVRAGELLQKTLEINRAKLGEDNIGTVNAMSNLANLYLAAGDFGRAEPLFKKAIEGYKTTLGASNLTTCEAMANLAHIYKEVTRLNEAEALYTSALEGARAAVGETHPTYGTFLNKLGAVCDDKGDLEKAEEMYRQALEIHLATAGEADTGTANVYNNLGTLAYKRGNIEQALEMMNKALAINKAALGERHASTASAMCNLGTIYEQMEGGKAKAEELYIASIEIQKALMGEEHPATGTSLHNLAVLYFHQERFEEARPVMEAAFRARRGCLGMRHPDTVQVASDLMELYKRTEYLVGQVALAHEWQEEYGNDANNEQEQEKEEDSQPTLVHNGGEHYTLYL